MTHLIVLVLAPGVALVVPADAANGTAKERGVVRVRAAHGALLIIIATKERILLRIVRLGRLLGRYLILLFNSCIIELALLLGELFLLFDYRFLRLVVELHEQTLRVVRSKLLPD